MTGPAPHVADPYRTLGVSRSATDAEIKAAHRKLAKRYHPATLPFIAATLLAVTLVEAALVRPYPGAAIGGVLGVLALAAGATLWARALVRNSHQMVAD